MSIGDQGDARIYTVLRNHEEQYSLWLKCNEVPNGWRAVGKEGSKAECLEVTSNKAVFRCVELMSTMTLVLFSGGFALRRLVFVAAAFFEALQAGCAFKLLPSAPV